MRSMLHSAQSLVRRLPEMTSRPTESPLAVSSSCRIRLPVLDIGKPLILLVKGQHSESLGVNAVRWTRIRTPIGGKEFQSAERNSNRRKGIPIGGKEFQSAERNSNRRKGIPIGGKEFQSAERNSNQRKGILIGRKEIPMAGRKSDRRIGTLRGFL